jgi:hypothetical protein
MSSKVLPCSRLHKAATRSDGTCKSAELSGKSRSLMTSSRSSSAERLAGTFLAVLNSSPRVFASCRDLRATLHLVWTARIPSLMVMPAFPLDRSSALRNLGPPVTCLLLGLSSAFANGVTAPGTLQGRVSLFRIARSRLFDIPPPPAQFRRGSDYLQPSAVGSK